MAETKSLVPSPASVETARSAAVERLSSAFEADRFGMEELETRLARVRAAGTVLEIEEAIRDLEPAAPRALAEVPNWTTALAIMGGAKRSGTWTVPKETLAVAVMGAVELDLREARLGPGVTRVHAFALMGGVEVVVPPDVRVECSGIGMAGAFEQTGDPDPDLADDVPVVRVSGLAVMGGVEISTRRPGETERQAKKRLKRQARAARALPPGTKR